MARKTRETYYLIERRQLNALPADAVLDMLRYDGATVECGSPTGFYLLRTEGLVGPHLARWRSFGVTVAFIADSASDATRWAQLAQKEAARGA